MSATRVFGTSGVRCSCVYYSLSARSMPKVTLLARLSDGLPLAASMADENDAYAKEVSPLKLVSVKRMQQNIYVFNFFAFHSF